MTFSFHNVFYLTSFSSTNPIVSKQGAVLGRAVCNLALQNIAFLYLGQQYTHFLLVTEPLNHPMHASHLCKGYGLSIQQRDVTTHLVVSDVLPMSDLTI